MIDEKVQILMIVYEVKEGESYLWNRLVVISEVHLLIGIIVQLLLTLNLLIKLQSYIPYDFLPFLPNLSLSLISFFNLFPYFYYPFINSLFYYKLFYNHLDFKYF